MARSPHSDALAKPGQSSDSDATSGLRSSGGSRHSTLIVLVAWLGTLFGQWVCAESAHFSHFLAWCVIVFGGATLVVLAWRFVVDCGAVFGGRNSNLGRGATALVVVTCVALQLRLFAHPSERITANNDQGSYSLQAVVLSRTGSLTLHASALEAANPDFQAQLVTQRPMQAQRDVTAEKRSPYYLGFFVRDASRGELVSQFPSGYPVLLACGYSVFRWPGITYANQALLCLAALLLAHLVLRWFGAVPAIVAFGATLFFPLHGWIANTLYAEPLVMVGWLAALLALELGSSGEGSIRVLAAAVASLGVAIAASAKIDGAASLIVLPLILFALANRQRWRTKALISLALVPALGAALVSYRHTFAYTLETFRSLTATRHSALWVVGLAIVLLAVAIALAWRKRRRNDANTATAALDESTPSDARDARDPTGSLVRLLRISVAIGLLGAFAFLYFIRPRWTGEDRFFYWPYNAVIKSYREATFLRLGWYLSPVGLWIAAVGISWLVVSVRHIGLVLLIAAGVATLLLFSYDLHNNPIQPYGMRRFLTYASPTLLIGIAASFAGLLRWQRWGRFVAAVMVLGIGAAWANINWRINRIADSGGLILQLSALAEKIPENAIVVTTGTTPLVELAAPLEHAFRRTVVVLNSASRTSEQREVLQHQFEIWRAQGRTLWALTSTSYLSFGFPVTEVAATRTSGEIRAPELAESVEAPPHGQIFRQWRYQLRQFELAGNNARPGVHVPQKTLR